MLQQSSVVTAHRDNVCSDLFWRESWLATLVNFNWVCWRADHHRAGRRGFNQFSVLALIAVGFITLRDAITRRLDPSVPSLFVALISAVPVLLFGGGMSVATGWTPMTSGMYGTITLAGIAITGGHLFAVMAMRNGEISFVAPFRYTGMIWAILFGFLLFGDLPDIILFLAPS